MPVGFLAQAQREHHGRYTGAPSPDDLDRYFHLDDVDLARIARKRGDHNRLGFAVQLGTVRYLGTFLTDLLEVPTPVVQTLARQLHITAIDGLRTYQGGEQRWDHVQEICAQYGYVEITEPLVGWRLTRWLYALCWTGTDWPSVLFERATTWLMTHKVLLPGSSILERHVARLRSRVELRLWRSLTRHISLTQQAQDDALDVLDALLQELFTGAAKAEKTHRLRTLKEQDLSTWVLAQVCQTVVDPEVPDSQVRAVAFGKISREALAQALAGVVTTIRPHGHVYPVELADKYKTVWRFLPMLVEQIRFGANAAGAPVVAALDWLRLNMTRKKPLGAAPREVVSKAWHPHVLRDEEAVDLRAYTFCTLERLHTALKRRDVFVALRAKVTRLLPRVDLPELILEVAARTGFTEAFTHLSERTARATDLHISLCAVLMAEACNTGLNALARGDVQPTQIMTDTGAYSDVVFGLFRLLGCRFSARLADVGGTRLWRIDLQADCGLLNPISAHRLRLQRIAPHCDDMLRLAGSLKLGRVPAGGSTTARDRRTSWVRSVWFVSVGTPVLQGEEDITGAKNLLVNEPAMLSHQPEQFSICVLATCCSRIDVTLFRRHRWQMPAASGQARDQGAIPRPPCLGMRKHLTQARQDLHAGVVEIAKEAHRQGGSARQPRADLVQPTAD